MQFRCFYVISALFLFALFLFGVAMNPTGAALGAEEGVEGTTTLTQRAQGCTSNTGN